MTPILVFQSTDGPFLAWDLGGACVAVAPTWDEVVKRIDENLMHFPFNIVSPNSWTAACIRDAIRLRYGPI